jgi:hypothetical protein
LKATKCTAEITYIIELSGRQKRSTLLGTFGIMSPHAWSIKRDFVGKSSSVKNQSSGNIQQSSTIQQVVYQGLNNAAAEDDNFLHCRRRLKSSRE